MTGLSTPKIKASAFSLNFAGNLDGGSSRSKREFHLFPVLTLDPGAGVIAGAAGDHHLLRLLAGPTAGEAEPVFEGFLSHGRG